MSLLEKLRTCVLNVIAKQDATVGFVLNDSSVDVQQLCFALEECMCHRLAFISKNSRETVSLWGLLTWVNCAQQERQQKWLQQRAETNDKLEAESWYNDLFKDELREIETTPIVASSTDKGSPFGTGTFEESPAIVGFNGAIRTVNALPHVRSPRGKIRAWIRHCLNVHILSKCLAGLMDPINTSLLNKYLSPGALMADKDAREILVSITSTLDRMPFSFLLTDVDLDDNQVRDTVAKKPKELPSVEVPSATVDKVKDKTSCAASVLSVLNEKNIVLHKLLRNTPHAILHPLAHNDPTISTFRCNYKLFGVSLKTLVVNSKTCECSPYDCGVGVPNLIEGCCRLIDASVLSSGIFVTNLDSRRLKQAVAFTKFSGTLSVWSSVHHATSILLLFLRDLPTKLLDCLDISKLTAIVETKDTVNQQLNLKNMINSSLDWWIKPTLVRLLTTLNRCLEDTYLKSNGLSHDRIFDIFYPLLFSVKKSSNNKFCCKEITRLLITQYRFIMEDVINEINFRSKKLEEKIEAIKCILSKLENEDESSVIKLQSRLKEIDENINDDGSCYETTIVEDKSTAENHSQKSIWHALELKQEDFSSSLKRGGELVVENLMHFLHEHEEIASQIISQRAHKSIKNYPILTTSVYITRMLCEILNILDFKKAEESKIIIYRKLWVEWCSKTLKSHNNLNTDINLSEDEINGNDISGSSISSGCCVRLIRTQYWSLFDEVKAFNRLFGITILLFDRNWNHSGATCMDFNTILAETKCQLQLLFSKKPKNIDDLWEIWMKTRSNQLNNEDLGIRQKPVATSHMHSYRIVWPGGINVREGPNFGSMKVGTREFDDTIDTVLRVGNWVKIREIPGIEDCGWVLLGNSKKSYLEKLS